MINIKSSEHKKKVREKIIESAFELFAQFGFHKTTIDMVASKANISKGLIYNYFENKEHLLEETIHFIFFKIEEKFFSKLDLQNSDNIFKDIIDIYFDEIIKDENFWFFFASILFQPDIANIARKIAAPFIKNIIDEIENLFKMKNSKNPREEAFLFGALLDGIFFDYFIMKPSYPIKKIKEFLIKKYSIGGTI